MTPAKKLWKEEQQTVINSAVETQNHPVNHKIYSLVKLLIIILLYYVIIIL